MPKRKLDPRLVAIEEKLAREGAAFDRWFARLKRAFNALDKCRRRITRLQRQRDDFPHTTAQETHP